MMQCCEIDHKTRRKLTCRCSEN